MQTALTQILQIKYPIVQGGMQWVSRAELVAAVSNAGGLGILTALTQPSPEALRHEIKKVRELTDKPFGVNLTFLPTLKPIPYSEYLDSIIESNVRIVETAGNNPVDYMAAMKAADIRVIHKCTSPRHALKAQEIGVDIVSIDGFECAGHVGESDIPGLVLIPATVEKVTIPVIASGGFCDARGLVAALALGASGINMGTRFMCTKEAPVHAYIKHAIQKSSENDTQLILRSLRNTSRVWRNTVSREVAELEREGAGIDKIGPLVTGAKGKGVYETGDVESGIWTVGLVQGLIKDIPSCADLISGIMEDAQTMISIRLPQLLKY